MGNFVPNVGKLHTISILIFMYPTFQFYETPKFLQLLTTCMFFSIIVTYPRFKVDKIALCFFLSFLIIYTNELTLGPTN